MPLTTNLMPSVARLLAIGCLSCFAVFARSQEAAPQKTIYFPGDDASWESIPRLPKHVDMGKLEEALDFAMKRRSSSVVILHRGRIVTERHQKVAANDARYERMCHGTDDQGRVIEDVASVQKSVVSVLVGIAQEKGLVKLKDPVHKHLGPGWSKATPEQEAKITLRHLVTMSSGLTEGLQYRNPPGTAWKYNTTAYSKSLSAVAAAAELTPNELTNKWLTDPLGMKHSKWVERPKSIVQSADANRYGFATTARDLSRFGLMMLAKGKWNGATIIGDLEYLHDSVSPSQTMNRAYGYLWWLNGHPVTRSANGPTHELLDPFAPKDAFSARGALGRKCYVSRSTGLVVVRLGDAPEVKGKEKFEVKFWRLLRQASGNLW